MKGDGIPLTPVSLHYCRRGRTYLTRSLLFGLAPYGLLSRRDGFLVAEEAAAERLQLLVELVENWDAGRDVELHDVALGHHVEHLDQGAQRVSVRNDEHVLAGPKFRDDARFPVGQHARQGVLERFRSGQRERVDTGIARVETRVPRIVGTQRRRRNIVAAAPDLDLRFAVLLDGLRLVEPLQGTVVAFVEAPAAFHRNPHAVGGIQDQPQRADRTLQHRSERNLRLDLFTLQLAPGLSRLLAPLIT